MRPIKIIHLMCAICIEYQTTNSNNYHISQYFTTDLGVMQKLKKKRKKDKTNDIIIILLHKL